MSRFVALVVGLLMVSGLSAQNQPRPTQPPKGKQKVSEAQKPTGSVTVKAYKTSGKPTKTVNWAPPKAGPGGAAPVISITLDYAIGVWGYDSGTGFVILGMRPVTDTNSGQTISPANDVLVDPNGTGNFVRGSLDAGDRIVAIDGYAVSSPDQVITAIQGAADKQAIEMDVADYRTGRVMKIKISAAKVSPNI